MNNNEKKVGGLSCAEVLTNLSDFIDGECSDYIQNAIEAHIDKCSECEQFGQGFAQMVNHLKTRLIDDLAPREGALKNITALIAEKSALDL